MKFAMNMKLWTTNPLDEKYLPVIVRLKEMGFDGVEIAITDPRPERFAALGRKLDAIGLERTAVTLAHRDANPISPDADNRKRG